MRHLTSEYWTAFVRSDGLFDGRRFELLVERLLNLHFDGGWKITQASWDGGRDVVREERARTGAPGESWAECKIHKAPVALRLLSNTLVMAVIGQPQRLMLFSYSPVIDNARLHLARFSMATEIPILVIDDDLLEGLILDHRGELRSFFARDLPDIVARREPVDLSWHVTKDIDIDPSRWADMGSISTPADEVAVVSIRSLLRVQIAMRNRDSRQGKAIELLVRGVDPPGTPFELLNRTAVEVRATIGPLETAFFEYYFRPLTAGTNVLLPSIDVVVDSAPLEPGVSLGRINVRPAVQPPLIGGRFHEAIAAFRLSTSLRGRPLFVSVEGRSGTGKSRLKQEFAAALVGDGFELHSFSGATGAGAGFSEAVRRLCAGLYRLPDIQAAGENLVASSPGGAISVERVLYDREFDAGSDIDGVLDLVARGFAGRRIGIVFDDVQYLDRPSLDFIHQLVHRYRDAGASLVCVFVFNTDMLPLNARAQALADALTDGVDSASESFLRVSLADLNSSEVDLFLDHMISVDRSTFRRGFTETYPMVAEMLRGKILARPLNLLQTVFYLADAGALSRRQDFYAVEDVEALHVRINTLPTALADVLDRRWALVLRAAPDLESFVRSLALLRSIDLDDMPAFELESEALERLIALGLVEERAGNVASFCHEQIERWFAEQYWSRPDVSQSSVECDRFDGEELTARYFRSYVIACVAANRMTPETSAQGAALVSSGLVADHLTSMFATSFLRALRRQPSLLPPATELSTVTGLVLLASALGGTELRLKLFDAEVRTRKRRLRRYASAGSELLWLLGEQASWFFGTQQDTAALARLEEALGLAGQFSFDSDRERSRSLSFLLNRMCVAQKSVANVPAAITAGEEGLRLARACASQELIFFGHVDLGYVHYDSVPASAALLAHWREAVRVHTSMSAADGRISDRDACATLIRAKCLLLEGNLSEAAEAIDEGTLLCNRTLDVFYTPKFILLRLLRELLLPEPEGRLGLLRRLSDMSIDVCLRYAARRSYWKALHARAKVETLAGDAAAAASAYAAALEQLLRVTTATNERLFRYFFEDLAIAFRKTGTPQPAVVASCRDPEIAEWMRAIAELDSDNFEEFLATYRPCATFSLDRENLVCP